MTQFLFVNLFLILSISFKIYAAPFPVSSTSLVTAPENGVFFANHGFEFRTSNLNWTIVSDDKTSIFETFRFSSLNNRSAQLTVRKDEIGQQRTLENYAKKWMKEYPQYGFEILTSKNMKLGGGDALLIDLVHRAKSQQIRQLVLHKSKKIVILTCLDDITKFKSTISECNQMMTSFQWK